MKAARPVIALAAFALLGACAQQIYYRAGATTVEVQRAMDQCALEATQAAPVRTQSRMIPGRFVPPRQICDAAGTCTVRPGYQELPRFESYDANEGQRALLIRTCLADRGIDRVSLPYCDAEAKASVAPAVTRTLPALTERSCIIPRGAGAYQIVTR